jgi:hypothetical protein
MGVALGEVLIKMTFWERDQILGRLRKAGVRVHIETEAEYNEKRESQKADAESQGLDAERYGRKDKTGNIVHDPGEQIISGENVQLENFSRDLELLGFKLVDLKVFQGLGAKAGSYQLVSTYAPDSDQRPKLTLTKDQRSMRDWMFDRIYGRIYVWRNFKGAQLDIPAMGIRQPKGKEQIDSIDLRLTRGALQLGNTRIPLELQGSATTA